MRSEPPRPLDLPPRLVWLRSQGLGVCCGLATTLLLAVGSVVISRTRDSVSAGLQLDDVRPFFDQPSLAHLWFYLLIPVMTLYGVNTALATLFNVILRWRAGMRNPQAYAAAFIHVAFLLALLAHLIGGLGGKEAGTVIASDWGTLPDGVEVRLVSLETDSMPNGMPKAVRAAVELRSPDGTIQGEVLGYNQPISSGFGSDLVLLQRPIALPAALLVSGEDYCNVIAGRSCSLAGREFRLADVRDGGPHGAMALIFLGDRSGWVMQGQATPVDAGPPLMLIETSQEQAVAVRLRHAPGNPWALSAALVLTLGTLLMWRRFV
jgi:hypothetical protein